jgi:hypothetical protein
LFTGRLHQPAARRGFCFPGIFRRPAEATFSIPSKTNIPEVQIAKGLWEPVFSFSFVSAGKYKRP